jgi:hypothetical protein
MFTTNTCRRRTLPSTLRDKPSPRVGPRLLAVIAAVGLATVSVPARQVQPPHAYFEALVARADHWKSYSLREAAHLKIQREGGYVEGSTNVSVSYAPNTDPDPRAQDAAKVVVPAFTPGTGDPLVQAITPSSLELNLSDKAGDVTRVSTSYNVRGRQLKINNEIVITATATAPLDRATGTLRLSARGAYGTQAMPHPAGSQVIVGGNSLDNQVRVPAGTFDGATWLFTWDAYFTDSFLTTGIKNYKAFQLESGNAIWLEPQVTFTGQPVGPPRFNPAIHIGVTGRMRSYNAVGGPALWSLSNGNQLGPGVTDNELLMPNASDFFLLHPNRWTRWWVRIEQRANDYDLMDAWMADEVEAPVQIYRKLPVSVRNGRIDRLWVEFNTSTAIIPPERATDFRDLVAYVRNIVILKDPPEDLGSVLLRPGSAQQLPRPFPPRNLRLGPPQSP